MNRPTIPQRVLAFDPGYERLGIAVLMRDGTREKLIYSTCARTPKELPLADRIGLLASEVAAVITKEQPDAMAFEKIFFNQSTSTALGVAEVRGMLETLASQYTLPVFQYSPQEVKLAVTGYGKSDKRAMAQMVTRLIQLPQRKILDDEIDAIAVGITCLSSTRQLPQ